MMPIFSRATTRCSSVGSMRWVTPMTTGNVMCQITQSHTETWRAPSESGETTPGNAHKYGTVSKPVDA